MWNERAAPAFGPALGLVIGTCLAPLARAGPGGVHLLSATMLIALGFALGRRGGFFIAALALGLINAEARWLVPADALAALDPERPVSVVGRLATHPTIGDGELLLRLEAERVIQDGRPRRAAFEIFISAAAEDRAPDAETLRGLTLGAELRLKGYLRRSAGYANRLDPRLGAWRMRLKSHRFLTVEAPPGPLAAFAGRLRRHAETALGGLEAPAGDPGARGARLARALVLGDRGSLPVAWQQTLRRLGLAHLLAVSGLHVGLVAVLALLLAAFLPRGPRYAVALVAVALYLAVVGPRPAVLRAAVMALLALAALLLERPPQSLNALSIGAFLLVLERPAMVADIGFQLSVAATAGMIVLAPRFVERWTVLPFFLRRPLAATAAAQMAVLPFLVPLSGVFHPLAAFYNLLAVPWLALFLLAALPAVLLAAVSPLAATLSRPVIDLLTAPLVGLASLPPSPLDLRVIDLGPAAATALALALVAWGAWPRRLSPVALIVLLLGLGTPTPRPGAELVLLDVGQGDAVILRDGARAVLIDGGGWPRGDFAARVLLPALAAAGVGRLDAVALTHADIDHCGGLADLARYLPIAEVWTAPLLTDDAAGRCVSRLLEAPGPRHRTLSAGELVSVGSWRLEVLHPRRQDIENRRLGDNDRSLVLMASWGAHRVILTGDLEASGERLLVRRYGPPQLAADVLKVAHHGSRTSTTPSLLDAVEPRLALISAGTRNPYGHPAPEVVERLAVRGIRVLRTDRSGRAILRFSASGTIEISLPAAPR